jgi:Gpi18-like mannosyltransferase
LLSWFHWDVLAYTGLAEHGYSSLRDTVFFPLWPLLIHIGGALFASTTAYYVTVLVLANLCFYLALVVFYRLLSEDFDPTIARNALFYICFSPYSLFFFAGYAESLFLLLCLSAFFCLQRSYYWLAGLCGFLAALTRSQGVLLVVPFAVIVIQRFWTGQDVQSTWLQKLRACLPIVLIPLGVVTFMLYLWYTKGDPLAFSSQEALSWNRHLTFPLTAFQPSRTLPMHWKRQPEWNHDRWPTRSLKLWQS